MKKTMIFGIVDYDGSHTNSNAGTCVKIPKIDKNLITTYKESLQAAVWHCLVSHPLLKIDKTKC